MGPSNCKKGDAFFSIGLSNEKHKRLIVCADDVQRDKLMDTVLKTYKQCQIKYREAMDGSNEDAINSIRRKQQRDAHDIEFSQSSLDTRTTYNNNEYSMSVSETNEYHLNKYNVSPLKPMASVSNKSDSQRSRTGSQLDKILETKQYQKNERIDNKWNRRQTNHLKGPMNVDPRFANSEKDLSASNQSAESFKIPLISDQSPNGSLNGSQNAMQPIEIDNDSKEIHPFKNTSTITPEPSVDTVSVMMSSDDGSVLEE